MNQAFLDVMQLFSHAAHGGALPSLPQAPLAEIRETALMQGVWQHVFLALKPLYQSGRISVDAALFAKWDRQVTTTVAKHLQRKLAMYGYLSGLLQAGISCCVLKGDSVARLYQNPDCRLSADIDLLVDPSQEQAAAEFLRKEGFAVSGRTKEQHHVECTHPAVGTVELHHKLYDELFADSWFFQIPAIKEPFVQVSCGGITFPTLGDTDNCLFLILHLVKHFLLGGISLRHVMDVLLFLAACRETADFDRIRRVLSDMHYETLLAVLCDIGVRYLGFSADDFVFGGAKPELSEKLLEDICLGGTFGTGDAEREQFSHIYNEAFFKKYKQADYETSFRAYHHQSGVRRLFPPKAQLIGQYRYLERRPYLLPVAWVQRMVRAAKGVLLRRRNVRSLVKVVPKEQTPGQKARMQLVRDLNML